MCFRDQLEALPSRCTWQLLNPLLRQFVILCPQIPESMPMTDEELDKDLNMVQSFVNKEGVVTSLSMSYINQLRLMTTHIKAIDIPVSYVTRQYFRHEAISIQILVTPCVDKSLLLWQEVIGNLALFSIYTKFNVLATTNISNNNIVNYLMNAIVTFSKAKSARMQQKKRKVKSTTKTLKHLVSSKLPGYGNSVKRTLDKLRLFDSKPDKDKISKKISDKIKLLYQSATFFTFLTGSKQIFLEALHCKASIASLLNETSTLSKDILEQMMVDYISDLFLSLVLFLIKGLWTSFQNIKVLLSKVSTSALYLRAWQVHYKRSSQYSYSLHSAHMACTRNCEFNELVLWG